MLHSDILSILTHAIKAPSGHNTQPWKFILNKNQIQIHPDHSRSLQVSDPDHHILFISLGCVLENIIIAAKEFGYKSRVALARKDAPESFLKIDLQKCQAGPKDGLFNWIAKRQTNRRVYSGTIIPPADLEQLQHSVSFEGVQLRLIHDKKELQKLEPLIVEGTRKQMQNHAQRQEVLPWLRFSKKEATTKGDGLWLPTFGVPNIPKKLVRLFLKYFLTERSELKKVKKEVQSSSAIGVFAIEKYDKMHLINLGRSFQRFALKATALGIAHAHLHAPCEDQKIKKTIVNSIGQRGHMQLLLRLGYARPMPYSFRRNLDEVLVEQLSIKEDLNESINMEYLGVSGQ